MPFRVRFSRAQSFRDRLRLVTIDFKVSERLREVSFLDSVLNFLKFQIAVLRHHLCFAERIGFPGKSRAEIGRAVLRGMRASQNRRRQHQASHLDEPEHAPTSFFPSTPERENARAPQPRSTCR